MAYSCGILLGQITRVSGYEGTVTVKLERFFSGKIPHIESVFLEIEGRPVPFFIADSDYSGADILRLRFEGYDSAEKVTEFAGCRIFLTTPGRKVRTIENIRNLIGYKVLTPDNVSIGTAEEIIQNPGQWLLRVISGSGKDILIPWHEHFIVKVDNRKKLMIMDIPEGLTEIN